MSRPRIPSFSAGVDPIDPSATLTPTPNDTSTHSPSSSPPRPSRPPPLRPVQSRSRSAQVIQSLSPSTPTTAPSLATPFTTGTDQSGSGSGSTVLSPLNPNTSNTAPAPASSERKGRPRAHTVSVSLRSSRRPRFDIPDVPEDEVVLASAGAAAGSRFNGSGSAGEGLTASTIDSSPGAKLGVRGDSPERGRRSTVSFSIAENHDSQIAEPSGELHDDVVGLLDCVDPEVSAVTHLQNMTNSIMFPNIPSLWSRRPSVVLPETPSDDSLTHLIDHDGLPLPATTRYGRARASTMSRLMGRDRDRKPSVSDATPVAPTTTATDDAVPSQSVALATLAKAEFQQEFDHDIDVVEKENELDRHVKHVLTKKDKFRRVCRGIWAFLKTPMGAFTAIYGFLVAFWGAAIVLFLLGWIPTSSKYRQDVWVEISSQVENGLFTLTGVGLIPWRVIDTYRMVIIYKLKRRTTKLRAQRGLAPIEDPDDLPDPLTIPEYEPVLSEKEQEQLRYQQEKFAKSQTWYRPHATATHRAFPIKWALWNTILMDGNSFFQCLLCGCMWGMTWHVRPPWTTGCLIPFSFLCGIGAAVLIWRGSVRTKKHKTVEDQLRQALGVPLAIGMPAATDGLDKTPTAATAALGEKPSRRATVGATETPDCTAFEGGASLERPGSGPRRATIAAPQRESGVRTLDRKAALGALDEGRVGDEAAAEAEEEVELAESSWDGKDSV